MAAYFLQLTGSRCPIHKPDGYDAEVFIDGLTDDVEFAVPAVVGKWWEGQILVKKIGSMFSIWSQVLIRLKRNGHACAYAPCRDESGNEVLVVDEQGVERVCYENIDDGQPEFTMKLEDYRQIDDFPRFVPGQDFKDLAVWCTENSHLRALGHDRYVFARVIKRVSSVVKFRN